MAGNQKQVDTITARDKDFFRRNGQIGGLAGKLSGRTYSFTDQEIGRLAREKSLETRRANKLRKGEGQIDGIKKPNRPVSTD